MSEQEALRREIESLRAEMAKMQLEMKADVLDRMIGHEREFLEHRDRVSRTIEARIGVVGIGVLVAVGFLWFRIDSSVHDRLDREFDRPTLKALIKTAAITAAKTTVDEELAHVKHLGDIAGLQAEALSGSRAAFEQLEALSESTDEVRRQLASGAWRSVSSQLGFVVFQRYATVRDEEGKLKRLDASAADDLASDQRRMPYLLRLLKEGTAEQREAAAYVLSTEPHPDPAIVRALVEQAERETNLFALGVELGSLEVHAEDLPELEHAFDVHTVLEWWRGQAGGASTR